MLPNHSTPKTDINVSTDLILAASSDNIKQNIQDCNNILTDSHLELQRAHNENEINHPVSELLQVADNVANKVKFFDLKGATHVNNMVSSKSTGKNNDVSLQILENSPKPKATSMLEFNPLQTITTKNDVVQNYSEVVEQTPKKTITVSETLPGTGKTNNMSKSSPCPGIGSTVTTTSIPKLPSDLKLTSSMSQQQVDLVTTSSICQPLTGVGASTSVSQPVDLMLAGRVSKPLPSTGIYNNAHQSLYSLGLTGNIPLPLPSLNKASTISQSPQGFGTFVSGPKPLQKNGTTNCESHALPSLVSTNSGSKPLSEFEKANSVPFMSTGFESSRFVKPPPGFEKVARVTHSSSLLPTNILSQPSLGLGTASSWSYPHNALQGTNNLI